MCPSTAQPAFFSRRGPPSTWDRIEGDVGDAPQDREMELAGSFVPADYAGHEAADELLLTLPAAEWDPTEKQYTWHIRSATHVDLRPRGLDHFRRGRASRGGLAVVMPRQNLRRGTHAYFIDQPGQVLIAGIEPMATRHRLLLEVFEVERLANLDRLERYHWSSSGDRLG